jgi:hypothetical protein
MKSSTPKPFLLVEVSPLDATIHRNALLAKLFLEIVAPAR